MNARFGGRAAHHTHGFSRAFACSGIRLGPLAADGQTAQVTNSAVAFNALEAFEVHTDLASQIAFDDVFAVLNRMDDLRELLFGEVLGSNGRIDFGVSQDVFGVAGANAVNIAQGDVNALIGWNFDADNASHKLGSET